MGGFGSPIHWLIIGIVALLLFGNRLPEVARSLGKAWNEFKRGLHDVSSELSSDPSKDERQNQGQLEPPRSEREGHKLSGDQPSAPHTSEPAREEEPVKKNE